MGLTTGSTSGAGQPRVGLALAGGGPAGAIYEVGAVRALDEAIEGVDFNDLHVYVGVSAGAFISACLANQLSTAQMVRAIVKPKPGEHPFVPSTFLSPAFGEIARRAASLPKNVAQSLWEYATHLGEKSLSASLTDLGRSLPVAVFDNEPIRRYLKKIYTMKGRTDDFRRLGRHLIVVAADLDSGQAVRLGGPGFEHVPISRAVQASTALPGLYPPVKIDGRFYVDGVLLKTLHASVALDSEAELLICVNPIVPVDTARSVEKGVMRRGKLIDRGLPSVLSQTFRTLIHSRLEVGMAHYTNRDADVMLLEPRRDDYEMFFTNIFGFSDRKKVCEHAYAATRRELLHRFDELAPILERHGLILRKDVLESERSIWDGVYGPEEHVAAPGGDHAVLKRLDEALDRLESLLA